MGPPRFDAAGVDEEFVAGETINPDGGIAVGVEPRDEIADEGSGRQRAGRVGRAQRREIK